MASAVLVTLYQRRKAAFKLRQMGLSVGDASSIEQLAAAISRTKLIPVPETKAERSLLVRSFSQGQVYMAADLERPEFVPLVLSEAMNRALARAHELYAIPSLMDSLEEK